MGRPYLVKLVGKALQVFQTCDIILHVPMFAEHKDAPMLLDRIPTDQYPVLYVQRSNASGRMAWQMDDPQFTISEVQRITLPKGD
ncbi:MAG: hypothetical protein IJI59_14220, partial [Clostridia bacterium]|nr:hypothetical protein [Clostridia bacterium]